MWKFVFKLWKVHIPKMENFGVWQKHVELVPKRIFPKGQVFTTNLRKALKPKVMRQNLGNLSIWVVRAIRWVENTLDVLQHVLATRIPKKSSSKLTQTPRTKITKKIASKIAKMKELGSMGERTQERNHSYINIIEVIYEA